LRANGATILGDHRLSEGSLLTKRFSRLWKTALRQSDCSVFGGLNA